MTTDRTDEPSAAEHGTAREPISTPSPTNADLVAEGNRWTGEEWIDEANPLLTEWISIATKELEAQQREIEAGEQALADASTRSADYMEKYAEASARAEALEKERDALKADKAKLEVLCSDRLVRLDVEIKRADKAEAEVAALRADLERARNERDAAEQSWVEEQSNTDRVRTHYMDKLIRAAAERDALRP
jgi:chromosome segregation ATPase